MILVDKNFMTPRTTDVITLQDTDGDYIYVNRALYDVAVIFNYTTQCNISKMEDSVLGNKHKDGYSNKDILSIMLDIYQSVPEPLNMLVPFMMLADTITVPSGLNKYEEKEFAYNLIDIICNSIDVRSFVKLPAHMRSPLTGLQHLAKAYKERNAHTMAMWFTGVEILPITDVIQQTVQSSAPVVTAPPVEEKAVNTTPTPLPIPAGSITTVPAADKDSVEPATNTISEEEYAELQRMMEEADREFEEQQKKQAEKSKQVEVPKKVKEASGINNLFASVLEGL